MISNTLFDNCFQSIQQILIRQAQATAAGEATSMCNLEQKLIKMQINVQLKAKPNRFSAIFSFSIVIFQRFRLKCHRINMQMKSTFPNNNKNEDKQ